MAKEEKQKDIFWAAVLAWLIPGAGHWYIGDRKRAGDLFRRHHADLWNRHPDRRSFQHGES